MITKKIPNFNTHIEIENTLPIIKDGSFSIDVVVEDGFPTMYVHEPTFGNDVAYNNSLGGYSIGISTSDVDYWRAMCEMFLECAMYMTYADDDTDDDLEIGINAKTVFKDRDSKIRYLNWLYGSDNMDSCGDVATSK